MKKFFKITLAIILFAVFAVPTLFMSACNFTVDYKSTSDKLNNALTALQKNKKFQSGSIKIYLFEDHSTYTDVITYTSKYMPKLEFSASSKDKYQEVDELYNTIFTYSINYIAENAKILATEPKVDTFTERQEILYEKLEKAIDAFQEGERKFETEIDKINEYYAAQDSFGTSSEEVYLLDFKTEYRDFISLTLDLANAIDDVTAEVYTIVDYAEFKDKEGTVFKSLEEGINIRVFEGYFRFLVDSFDCRTPKLAVDANETMEEIIALFNTVKANYINLFREYIAHTSYSAQTIIKTYTDDATIWASLTQEQKDYLTELKNSYGIKASLTEKQIAKTRDIVDIYFEEMDLYENAYAKLNFVKFYFEDDCDLDGYVKTNYANLNYYKKINDYLKNVLPDFTTYTQSIFLG